MQDQTSKVEIDPTTELPARYLGSDEDGSHYGPVTLYDAIVDAAATRLVDDQKRGLRKAVAVQVEQRIVAMLDAELPAIFQAALNEPMEITDEWGGVKKSKTLAQVIGERARTQMEVKGRSYNDTVMDEVIREEVDYSLKEVLTKEVQAAKEHLKAQLREKAAELLAAESLREAGVRR
jgi:hypothetical protein